MSTIPVWTYESDQAGAMLGAGTGVAGIGDVNGDGYDDILVGAQNYDNGETNEGQAYLFYGATAGLSAAPDWTAESNQAGAAFGWAVAAAGDVNQDGYADFLIGADEYDAAGVTQAGRVYLYYGSAAGPNTEPDWTAGGTQTNGRFGHDVSLAGDVNGDGILEIIIGEQRYSNGEYQEGRALLYGAYALVQTETTITYEYDPLYRLTGAVYTGTMNAAYEYVYDAVGNMTAYTDTVGTETTSVSRTFDAANRLQTAADTETGTTSYTFDANGNLTQILPPGVNPGDAGEQLYAYDQRNLLTANTVGAGGGVYNPVADYVYDGAANRIQQIDHSGGQPITTTYHNDNLGLSQVLIADNGITATHNLFGLDLIHVDDGNETRTLLPDGLGSARTEMANGQIETVTTYEPFGSLLAKTGSSGTTYGFTGEQHDAATGLLYLRARYYNPAIHTFMGQDAHPGQPRLPSTIHGYSYAANNPALYTDPTGYCVSGQCDAWGGRWDYDFNPRDLTLWLYKEMTTNINDPRLQNIRRLNKNATISILGCVALPPLAAYGVGALFEAKSQYESLVADRMPWDFKHKIKKLLGPGITLCSTIDCDRNIEFSVPGNIHFGFVSREAGYSGIVTHIGAGKAEIEDPIHDPSRPNYRPYDGEFGLVAGLLGVSLNIGDEPVDHQAVQFGIYLHNNYGRGLTLGQFRQELSRYMNRLDHKLPYSRPVRTWIANHWPYPVGFFEPTPPAP